MSTIIRIDPIACQAYGYCAELLPELVSVDEWGYPVVDGDAVAPGLIELARRAAKDCPRRAFLLTRGEEPSPPSAGGSNR